MNKLSSLSGITRDAMSRHRGVGPLFLGLVRILFREGPRGFFSRLRIHARRLGAGPQGGSKGTAAGPDPAAAEAVTGDGFDRGGCKIQSPPAPGLESGLLLIGHPYAVSGRAEDVRTGSCACDRAGIPFAIRNMLGDYGKEGAARHKEFPFYDRVGTDRRFKANLFMLNADEMDVCYQYQGAEVFRGPYNIGCMAWELAEFPDAWAGTIDYVHEIWAQSRFIQQAISEKTELPVIWMPYAVQPGAAAELSRGDLGLPEDAFLFLFFFDFRSYRDRKNPWAVMEAFTRAFPPGDGAPVHLVIKTNGTDEKQEEFAAFLDSPLARDPRVQIIDRVLDDRGINALVCRCDCFVSLHRSEGFGRGLAEAMYFGKPVIATAYSGNLDFMNPLNACMVENRLIPVEPGAYPYGEGQLWADPDIEHAAWYMRRLVDEPAYSAEIGGRASAYIREHHSYRAVGAMYRRRLERLGLLDT